MAAHVRERHNFFIFKYQAVAVQEYCLTSGTDMLSRLPAYAAQHPIAASSGVPRVGGGSNHPPPPKFRRPSKIVPNSTRLWKLLKIDEFRKPAPQDVRKKGSKTSKTTAGSQLFYISNDK